MKKIFNENEKKLIELLNRLPDYRKQSEFIDYFKKEGIELSQSTISRYLENIGAKRDDNGTWYLEKTDAFERNLPILQELFNEATNSNSIFINDVKIAVLKTAPYYNKRLAKKIEDTFVDEVFSTFCPNDTDILIYYFFDQEKESRFVNVMSQLCDKGEVVDPNSPNITVDSE